LWQRLGIQRKADGSVELVAHAPLANVREAITSPPVAVAHRASSAQ